MVSSLIPIHRVSIMMSRVIHRLDASCPSGASHCSSDPAKSFSTDRRSLAFQGSKPLAYITCLFSFIQGFSHSCQSYGCLQDSFSFFKLGKLLPSLFLYFANFLFLKYFVLIPPTSVRTLLKREKEKVLEFSSAGNL